MLLFSMGTMSILIVVAILSCLTAWSMHKCCVFFNSLFLFVFLILFLIGGAILYIPGKYGTKFIHDSCEAANNNTLELAKQLEDASKQIDELKDLLAEAPDTILQLKKREETLERENSKFKEIQKKMEEMWKA